MTSNTHHSLSDSNTHFSYYFILAGFFIAGLFISQFISILVLSFFYEGDVSKVISVLEVFSPNTESRYRLMFMQGINSIGAFIISPLLYLYLAEKKSFSSLLIRFQGYPAALFITFLVTLVLMPFNALMLEWNQIKMPDFLADFEQSAMAQEKLLEKITIFITTFDNFGQFLVGLLVIAIIPAIGEEVLFRGIIQKKLMNTINPHVAIWLTAFFFSAVHFQFYGILPRMILGALFGYLFWFSGNLWWAILSHFFNNATTLLLVYLYRQKITQFDIEAQTSVPLIFALISLVFTLLLMWLFKRLLATPKAL
ncbi:MAG: CPBP family intramembrane metalloprotease [Cytophagales bacterium]|nr:MAG: CPBP family intramembrane metalloprotease [Cytophagales bacterium]